MRKMLSDVDMKDVNGGVIVNDVDAGKYWLVREDGSVIAPTPTLEKAEEFARTLNVSLETLTKDEYEKRFGKALEWE